ncbi:DUF1134 domain-containing protein [Robiginitomaculum antarcticum]|uniref:DUF1134 domain-containing protein n=1 Tax=Robiginitomaculum antarcticum TaxID=437507 RepID=UPI00036BCCFA|nr:EipA family protein [Robiginitomaculum antarcticum]
MLKFATSSLTAILLASAMLSGCATNDPQTPRQQAQNAKTDFEQSDVVQAVSTHLGVTSESAASVVERLFREQGRPDGYITGEEGGGALVAGLFWGKGTLWMKDGSSIPVFWQGPTIGWDAGGDASKVFTLVYNLDDPNYIFQRFPKAEGSAFLIAGMGVNYQRANGITLAPIRSGIGLRLGANVGYSSYSRKRQMLPF